MDDQANSKTVSLGEWMLTMFLMCLPLVNLIMLLVWAFGGGAAPSKANWAKAALIWMLIGIGLWLLAIVAFGGLFAAMAASGAGAVE